MSLDAVLATYPSDLARHSWEPVNGGFSGASVWKGTAADGSAVALKCWPAGYPADRLRTIHHWVAAAAHLPFVPRVIPPGTGASVVETAAVVWALSTWLPGEPDRHPSDARLVAACTALAELHRTWFPSPLGGEGLGVRGDIRNDLLFIRNPPAAPHPNPPPQGGRELTGIPAVYRRLGLFASYRSWLASGGRPVETGHARLNRKCADAFALLPSVIPDLERALAPWRDRPVPTGPCLCDVHAGHVLFTGEAVTGVID